jgi:hypothetical protein
MIAEAKDSTPQTTAAAPQPVDISVNVALSPTGEPVITFDGLTFRNNVQVDVDRADFTLTVVPDLPPGASAKFANDPVTRPIDWLTPGSGQPIDQPAYITDLALSGDQMILTFTDWNSATAPKYVLVSFVVNIDYTAASGETTILSSHHPSAADDTYTSHDPTIINVDPTAPTPEPPQP